MANPARGLGEQMAGGRKSRLALIGYMVNTREDRPPSRDFSLFRIAAMDETLRNLGARLFVYSPRRIDPDTGLVDGLLIDNGRFVPATRPVPTINGSWYIGRDKSISPKMNARESRTWADDNGIEIYPLQSFSKILKDKLKSSRLVRDFDPALQPKTEAFRGTLEQLTRFVRRYRLVFVKPRFGSKGDNIFSIRRAGKSLRLAYYSARRKRESTHESPADALAEIVAMTGNRRFLIQQGIAIHRHADAPFIFRVIMLDDGTRWQWVHKAVLAAPGSDIANTTQGGSNWNTLDLLAEIYGADGAEELFAELRRVSFDCVRYLDTLFPGQLMEVAYDFVLDRKRRLKVLEINTLPGMTKPGLPPEPAFDDILDRQPAEREIFDRLVLPHGACLARFLHTRLRQREARMADSGEPGEIATGARSRSPRDDDILADADSPRLDQAIARQARHLVRACLADGSFRQHRIAKPGKLDPRFDVLRHAGAIYALDRYHRWRPDDAVREAALRAGGFLQANFVAPLPGEDSLLAVWSRSEFNHLGKPDQVRLGWVGLGLAALACLERHSPGFTPLQELRALGEFLRWSQRADGSFDCLYWPDQGGWEAGWNSVHYPGQAAFGLSMLYALDPSPRWLESAARALDYLARSRRSGAGSGADYWTLLAMARWLPQCTDAQLGIDNNRLLDHARQVCIRILARQVRRALRPGLDGGFDPDGRTLPTATGLRGLLAARGLEICADPEFDTWLATATRDGIAFLLRACIRGNRIGAMPRAVAPLPDDGSGRVRRFNRRAGEPRIDYAAHALCAMIEYQCRAQIAGAEGNDRSDPA